VGKKIIMCYGKTRYTPGRYLEDGLRNIGVTIDLYEKSVDFSEVNLSDYDAVIFVESPSKPSIKVNNMELVTIPKIFWIHHGENRLDTNLQLAKKYRADLVLMAHSLHLATKFSSPVRFFPFGMSKEIFNCNKELKDRRIDIASIGSNDPGFYGKRRMSINTIKKQFSGKYRLSLDAKAYLYDLAKIYGNSKIVFNQSANTIKSINMRLFEGMGCGALVFSDYVPGMEKLFIEDTHYVSFKDHHELLEKMDYYLKNTEEAQVIATAAYEHLLNHHTYEHRANELLSLIQELSNN
jgi:spore maturation protein CgeB